MYRCLVLLLLLTSTGAPAQESTASSTPHRIICTIPKGKVVKMVRPSYPAEAIEKRIAGPVVLEVEINRRGEPTVVKVTQGSPILADAAENAVRQWRWKPLKLNGQTVRVRTTITVNFRLDKK